MAGVDPFADEMLINNSGALRERGLKNFPSRVGIRPWI
jgi:hypothetical protein